MRASGGDDGETIPSGAVALPFLWLLVRLRPSNARYSELYAVRSEAETGVEKLALFGNILHVKGGEHMGERHLCRNKLHTWPQSENQAFPVGFKDTWRPLTLTSAST